MILKWMNADETLLFVDEIGDGLPGLCLEPSDALWATYSELDGILDYAVERFRVNDERDRRIYGGVPFTVDGTEYIFDSDERSQSRVGHSAALARFATAGGALADDYKWHGGSSDFQWITQAGDLVALDAIEMSALGDAFLAWISGHVFAARTIKRISPIPSEFADDARWP